MENKKNNKGIIVLLGVVVVILSILCVLFATGTISFKSNDVGNTNENFENNKIEENYIEKSALLDKTKIEKYKNGDGTYGTQKSFVETNYNTHLNLIGEVKVCYQSDCHKITNLNNVVDMLKWTVAGAGEAQKVLFLLDNGDLYSYAYEDYSNNNFEAKKIEGISNVDRIIDFSYSGKEKGGNWGAIAITKNNEYIEIYRESI